MKMKNTPKTTPKSAPPKPTQSALAAQLGVTRQLIAAHCKKPDAPGLDDVAGWSAYFAQHGRVGSCPPDLRRALAEVKLDILRETKAKLVRENKVATRDCGEMIPRERVEELLRAFGNAFRGAVSGFEACGQAVFMAKDADAVRAIIYRAYIDLSFTSMAAVRGSKKINCPDWMLKVFCKATELAPWSESTYAEMSAFACEFMCQNGQRELDDYRKRRDALKHYYETTDSAEKARIWRDEVAPLMPS
jgi:hypothetical protein